MDKKTYILGGVFLIILVAIIMQAFPKSTPKNPENVITKSDNISTQETRNTDNKEGGDTMTRYKTRPKMQIDISKDYTAVIHTNKGDMTLVLTAEKTPLTVNNFVFLAKEGFYKGVIFHRVIKDFMIQGGDPTGTGRGGPGYTFEDEITPDQAFDGPGVLAMANSGPNTNGSQFFITHAATPWLNGNHTIFGHVTKGLDVLNTIATTEVAGQDKPVEDIVITSIDIIEK